MKAEEVQEQYIVLDLQANIPLSSSLFRQRTVVEEPGDNDSTVDDEHLREAIKAMKDKYR